MGQQYVAIPSIPVNETILRVGLDFTANQTVLNATITGLPFLNRGLDDLQTYNFTVAALNNSEQGQKADLS